MFVLDEFEIGGFVHLRVADGNVFTGFWHSISFLTSLFYYTTPFLVVYVRKISGSASGSHLYPGDFCREFTSGN
jgi:hypothetical protein